MLQASPCYSSYGCFQMRSYDLGSTFNDFHSLLLSSLVFTIFKNNFCNWKQIFTSFLGCPFGVPSTQTLVLIYSKDPHFLALNKTSFR